MSTLAAQQYGYGIRRLEVRLSRVHFLCSGKWHQLGRVLVGDPGVAGSNPVFPIYGEPTQPWLERPGSYPGGRGFLRRYKDLVGRCSSAGLTLGS